MRPAWRLLLLRLRLRIAAVGIVVVHLVTSSCAPIRLVRLVLVVFLLSVAVAALLVVAVRIASMGMLRTLEGIHHYSPPTSTDTGVAIALLSRPHERVEHACVDTNQAEDASQQHLCQRVAKHEDRQCYLRQELARTLMLISSWRPL